MSRFWPILACMLCLVAIAPAWAAEAPVDSGLAAMKAAPLSSLVGKWEGGGWIRRGPAEPERFVGRETVESRLDGRVILVEGEHWTPDRSRKVHHALAMLVFDPEKKAYRFRTQLENGQGGDYPARLEDGALVWETETPGGKVRFTIRADAERWHEVGHIERGGKWQQFFEMELKRVGG